jgi:2-iminobutanoate/2-iminopropanoate deaminase
MSKWRLVASRQSARTLNAGRARLQGSAKLGYIRFARNSDKSYEENMSLFPKLLPGVIAATVMTSTVASAQNLEVKRYNPSEWTKTFFTEIITVNGPGKTIYLAGVGAEDEKGTPGSLPPILHLGNAYEQCRYAYDKIKRALATHGASLADAVKQVVYVTDVRYQSDVAKCRREAYGDGPIPANTFLVISGLAVPGMLLEIDVTAVVGNN